MINHNHHDQSHRQQQPLAYFYTPPAYYLLFTILTLGLYSQYWFYRNWQVSQRATEAKINPMWRAVWRRLFCYPLFKEIIYAAKDYGHKSAFSPEALALFYIWTLSPIPLILCLSCCVMLAELRVLEYICSVSLHGFYDFLFSYMLGVLILVSHLLTTLPIIYTQRAIKFHNAHTRFHMRTRRIPTSGEWIVIAIGIVTWTFIIRDHLGSDWMKSIDPNQHRWSTLICIAFVRVYLGPQYIYYCCSHVP